MASVAAAKNDVELFRAQDLVELFQDFAEFLPDMVVHASIHDMGPNIFGDDFRADVERLLNEKACEWEYHRLCGVLPTFASAFRHAHEEPD